MINNAVVMGRLTADPELRTTTTGKEVCSFCIAVDRSYAKNGEERTADFINIVTWENAARFVCNYFSKGSMIAIQGRIQTRSYEDKTGAKRTAFEVVAHEVSFCGSKNQSAAKPTADNQIMSGYSNASASDFDEITDDEDLPF